jgi:hypothetical protein
MTHDVLFCFLSSLFPFISLDKESFGLVRFCFILQTTQHNTKQCEKDASQRSTPGQMEERYDAMVRSGNATSYYHPPLHAASFILPLWAHQHIYSPEAPPPPPVVTRSTTAPNEEL